jgi:hypothetical protein
VRFSIYPLHMRPRVQRAPGLPCALFSLGRVLFPKLGRMTSRECEGIAGRRPGLAPGPIRRVLSFQQWSRCLSIQPTPGVMGPGARPGRRGHLEKRPCPLTSLWGSLATICLENAETIQPRALRLLDCFAYARNDRIGRGCQTRMRARLRGHDGPPLTTNSATSLVAIFAAHHMMDIIQFTTSRESRHGHSF